MSRLTSLWRSTASLARSSTHSLTSLNEPEQLEDAMVATMYLLEDDLSTAENLLGRRDTAFHKLGRAVLMFMKSVLGMEHEIMEQALTLLTEAESSATTEQRHAQSDPKSFRSSIYAPGTEFEFCRAQAQVMSAIIAVLNENVAEALKGFYRIRKAYMTLERIMQMERDYIKARDFSNVRHLPHDAETSPHHAPRLVNGSPDGTVIQVYSGSSVSAISAQTNENHENEAEEEVFVDASEAPWGSIIPVQELSGLKTESTELMSHPQEGSSLLNAKSISSPPSESTTPPIVNLATDSCAETLSPTDLTNIIDTFIHSGVSLYCGMLQLMLSLIPPAFGRLLSLIGFQADRERGLSLLWHATSYPNINGAVASLTVLGYYTALVSNLDILPSTGPGSFPHERCETLLRDLRARHPRSVLCLMQDVRMMTASRQLKRAVETMKVMKRSELKQLGALQVFEYSLNCMYLHRYPDCAEGFLNCVELSNWSKAMYFYIAGCAHLELYRVHKYGYATPMKQSPLSVDRDLAKAKYHANVAAELLGKVLEHAGKKRIFARQLPFDVFCSRKVAKWTARASVWGIDLVDAVGISPLEEMTFFWGGYGRMSAAELEDSLAVLAWNDGTGKGPSRVDVSMRNPEWDRETIDERAALSVLRGTIHRQLGAVGLAKQIIKREVIDRFKWEEFKNIKDGERWPAPIARYEMAVCWWLESDEGKQMRKAGAAPIRAEAEPGERNMTNRAKLRECGNWLEQAARWDSYDLEVRFGTRISTGRQTLANLGVS